MDISSTTSTATISTSDTSASTQSQRTSKSENSFEDEMKKVSEESETQDTQETNNDSETKAESSEENSLEKNASDDENNNSNGNDYNNLLKGSVDISVQNNLKLNNQNIQDIQLNNIQTLIDANRQLSDLTKLGDSLVSTKVDYSNISMSFDDAKFFSDLVQNSDKTLQNVVNDLKSGLEENVNKAAKNVKVSSTLMNALQDAVKTNQPFRINFDKDISVVIKVDKDGALSATFIPGDKAVEEYLRQNISILRQRFDEQELSYKDLSYSRQKNNQEQNKKNNKENDHE